MKRHGILILECIDAADPGSEGRLLRELFRLMEVEVQLQRIKSIKELLQGIDTCRFQHVHVSTHGVLTPSVNFCGWWTSSDTGSRRVLDQYAVDASGITLVSTACHSGSRGFSQYVLERWGCKNYIAPRKSPTFHAAAFFSHIYYHKLFRKKLTVKSALSSYNKKYKNPFAFTHYTNNEI